MELNTVFTSTFICGTAFRERSGLRIRNLAVGP